MTTETTSTGLHLDPNDPKYELAAANILARHDRGENEANITSAVRDFLILTNKLFVSCQQIPGAGGKR